MSLWLVEADRCAYDQYDAFVIRAATKEDAEKIATERTSGDTSPQTWTAEPIPVDGEEETVLGSFNAG